MKTFIFGSAMTIVMTFFLIFQNNTNIHQEKLHHLKFIAEESAAAGGQYISLERYSEGEFVFNRSEAETAIQFILKEHLNLSDSLTPNKNGYWQNKVTYEVMYFDDSNSSFPLNYRYDHGRNTVDFYIDGPSVLVKVIAGKAKYDWLPDADNNYQIALYTFNEY